MTSYFYCAVLSFSLLLIYFWCGNCAHVYFFFTDDVVKLHALFSNINCASWIQSRTVESNRFRCRRLLLKRTRSEITLHFYSNVILFLLCVVTFSFSFSTFGGVSIQFCHLLVMFFDFVFFSEYLRRTDDEWRQKKTFYFNWPTLFCTLHAQIHVCARASNNKQLCEEMLKLAKTSEENQMKTLFLSEIAMRRSEKFHIHRVVVVVIIIFVVCLSHATIVQLFPMKLFRSLDAGAHSQLRFCAQNDLSRKKKCNEKINEIFNWIQRRSFINSCRLTRNYQFYSFKNWIWNFNYSKINK